MSGVKAYRDALVKCGIAVEIQSPEYMNALCEAVFEKRSSADNVARLVVSHGRFTTRDEKETALLIPPDEAAVRSVVAALMLLPARNDKAGFAALPILQALRPSGRLDEIAVAKQRLVRDVVKDKAGDIAAAYSAQLLGNSWGGKTPAIPTFEHEGKSWTALQGSQVGLSTAYDWECALIVPKAEWDPNPDDWHYFYGRPVRFKRGRDGFVGRRFKFVAK